MLKYKSIKIEELRNQNAELRDELEVKNKELEEQYDKLGRHFIQNHVSKDKIKAKIEDKKKEAERHIECVDVTEGQAMYKIVEELEGELLEEEE